MKTLIFIVLFITIIAFVLSALYGDKSTIDDGEEQRKQLNDWQDRDILED